MSKASDLVRLAEVAQLMLDHRLAKLRSAAAELERSRMQIAALNQAPQSTGLDAVTDGKVALTYDRWADQRRADLNLVVARQTATMIEARSDAQAAFGRVQALQGLATRLKENGKDQVS